MRNINNYEVFKNAHQLTLEIYELTKIFPKKELEYQLLLAKDLKYITEDKWELLTKKVTEIVEMLYGIIKK